MVLLLATLGNGCALRQTQPRLFDLGPLPITTAAASLPRTPPLRVIDVQAPAWLAEPRMFYRLLYDNAQQARAYSASRWLIAPGLMLDQRLRQQLVAAGAVVLPAADAAAGMPVLRIELEDFVQNFSSPSSSSARVVMRASLYTGYGLLAQNTFYGQVAASSADAAGGARALASASDRVISALICWLAANPINR